MRKVLLALVFLCFLSTIHAQWSAMPTLNGPTLTAINLSYPAVGTEVLLAGTFTATTSGTASPLCILYDAGTNSCTAVSGFNASTDVINGFYLGPDNVIRVYGKFQSGTDYYGVYTFDGTSVFAPDPVFKFTGQNTSNQKIDAAWSNGTNTLVYGALLSEINNVPLSTGHSVALVSGAGVVTNQPSLVPSIAGETPSIKNIRWDGSQWIILGNFSQLGSTACYDLARWNETVITPVNMTTNANTYSKDYESGVVGWSGITTSSGVTSPGAIGLSANTLYGLNGGWYTISQDVQTFNGETWICGSLLGSAGPSNRSRIASYGSTWTNREGNLTTNNTSLSLTIYGMCVAVDGSGNPVMVAYGNLIQGVNSQFSYMARWVSTALPVELTYFEVKSEKNANLLIWETETENLNKGFYVEKSLDGYHFVEIGFVASKAHGQSTTPIKYDFRDVGDATPIVYYRLRQTDVDGYESYSNLVQISRDQDAITVYPNPVNNFIQVNYNSLTEEDLQIIIVDITGREIKSCTKTVYKGSNHFTISFEDMPGTYMLKLGKFNKIVVKNN